MSQVKYSDGEKVLCYHGNLIYEAKVLKSKMQDRVVKYHIHYAGWSKNWDEWVGESRVLKFNPENCEKQKEVQKKMENSTKSKKTAKSGGTKKGDASLDDPSTSRSSTPSKDVKDSTPRSRGSSVKPTASSSSSAKETIKSIDEDVIKKKRQRLDTSNSNEGEEKTIKPEITISIPKDLKTFLVDDWHAINSQHKLVELPAKITVEEIVEKYKQNKKSKSGASGNGGKGQSCEDISNGILEYFNVMLGSQLLYKVERMQYADILQKFPDKPMSQIYGAFHLLRLFVKLGTVLSFTTLDKNNIRVLIGHLGEFLKFLETEHKEFFTMSSFNHPQTGEYLRRANQ